MEVSSPNPLRDVLLERMQGKSAEECVDVAMVFMKQVVLDLKEMHLLPPFNGAMSSSERRQLYQALSQDG